MSDPRMFYPIQPIQPIQPAADTHKPATAKQPDQIKVPFQSILRQELNQVKFSQHAKDRLEQRNIKLDDTQIERLQDAVEKAAQKGARESLVLMDTNLAFVVSVRNRTVITAMDGASIKDNVFTNIDSAIFI